MLIYKLTNLITGKIYFGQTCQKLSRRLYSHKTDKTKSYISRAIQKYRWENFKVEVVFESINQNEIDYTERYFIAFYNTNKKEFGYNLESGGKRNNTIPSLKERGLKNKRVGIPLTQEWKNNISKSNKGRVVTEDTRKKISNTLLGHKGNFLGLSHTDTTKGKISKANTGKKRTEDMNKNQSERQKGKLPVWLMKNVLAIKCSNGKVYSSMRQAAIDTNISHAQVFRLANNGKSQNGLFFKKLTTISA